ncbi:hypothetical protein HZS_559 [Henneguya salminicola]|nr:hypothetical protein HZS_559 [Henneguya salminicola]
MQCSDFGLNVFYWKKCIADYKILKNCPNGVFPRLDVLYLSYLSNRHSLVMNRIFWFKENIDNHKIIFYPFYHPIVQTEVLIEMINKFLIKYSVPIIIMGFLTAILLILIILHTQNSFCGRKFR